MSAGQNLDVTDPRIIAWEKHKKAEIYTEAMKLIEQGQYMGEFWRTFIADYEATRSEATQSKDNMNTTEPAFTTDKTAGTEKRPLNKLWQSVAIWDSSLGFLNNITTDIHYTEREAENVCRLLTSEGLGGRYTHFPLKTKVVKLDPTPNDKITASNK